MSGDYDDLLNRTWEEIPEEQMLPIGNWHVKGKNAALIKPREEGKKLQVLFSYTAYSPIDVDEDELAELGEYDIAITQLSHRFFIETPADWNDVKKHLKLHDVTVEGDLLDSNGKLSFNKDFRKSEVVAYLEQDHWQDPATKQTRWGNKMSGFRPVED